MIHIPRMSALMAIGPEYTFTYSKETTQHWHSNHYIAYSEHVLHLTWDMLGNYMRPVKLNLTWWRPASSQVRSPIISHTYGQLAKVSVCLWVINTGFTPITLPQLWFCPFGEREWCVSPHSHLSLHVDEHKRKGRMSKLKTTTEVKQILYHCMKCFWI